MATASADFFIVDQEGVVFKKIGASLDLPLIFTKEFDQLKMGQKVDDDELIQAITLVSLLTKIDIKPEIARVSKEEIVVFLKEGPEVVFSSQKEPAAQVGSLQLILSRTKIEGKRLKRIDLRFDKPVIVER